MTCDWNRRDEDAPRVCFLDGAEEPLARLCGRHARELVETFELFRKARERRLSGRGRPVESLAPPTAPDPNRCRRCGHPGAAHTLRTLDTPAGCLACEGYCAFEGGWTASTGSGQAPPPAA